MTVLENTKVLVIDDTASIRTFLKISMMDHGVDFLEAATAAEGMTLCETESPEVVILDLGLPDRDGLDILPEIVSNADGTDPKVVVLTVRSDRETREAAYNKGASAYLTKPFIMDDLIETIEHILH
ncbi:response regulator [Kordiimonas sp.]|uniref:response regulator n=1 Tax=Kordiimonas sp. TaxID=1970157 RepID=UPI003A8EF856